MADSSTLRVSTLLPTGFADFAWLHARARTFDIDVSPSDSIGAVKEKIQALEGILHQNQRLICANRELIHGRLLDCRNLLFVGGRVHVHNVVPDEEQEQGLRTFCRRPQALYNKMLLVQQSSTFSTALGGTVLNVKHMDTGRTMTLDVQPSDTIDAVKAKIQSLEGIPCEEQSLIFDGKRMEGRMMVKGCNLQKDNTFYLTREKSPRSGPGSSMLLHVKASTGRTITLVVQPSEAVDAVWEASRSDLPNFPNVAFGCFDPPIVSFADKRMEEGRTFANYNVQSDCNVSALAPRRPGVGQRAHPRVLLSTEFQHSSPCRGKLTTLRN